MGYNDFFRASWMHAGSEQHRLALIFDGIEEVVKSVSLGEFSIVDEPEIVPNKFASWCFECGFVNSDDKGLLVGASKEHARELMVKIGISLALVQLNPYNSRLPLRLQRTSATKWNIVLGNGEEHSPLNPFTPMSPYCTGKITKSTLPHYLKTIIFASESPLNKCATNCLASFLDLAVRAEVHENHPYLELMAEKLI